MQCQSHEAALVRFKLVAVAILGSVSLGTSSAALASDGWSVKWIVGLIPLVCLYVDAAIGQNTMQLLVIATFLRTHGHPMIRAYEDFAVQCRNALGALKIVTYGSTLILSGLIAVIGVWRLTVQQPHDTVLAVIETASGTLGLVLGVFVMWYFRKLQADLDRSTAGDRRINRPS